MSELYRFQNARSKEKNYLTLLSVRLGSTDVSCGIQVYGKHTATDMQEGST